MNTREPVPPDLTRPPQKEKTLGSLKLLPCSRHDVDNVRPNTGPHTKAAATRDQPVNPDALTDAEEEQRMRDVLHIIADMERAKQHQGTQEQRVELADWLVHTPYSLRQIRKAAQSIAVMETYGRPFAREFWFKAFAQPLIDSRRIRELCRKAYEKGRKDERKEIEAQSGESSGGIDTTTKRLLEAEKELMILREGDKEQKARINSLEREIRRLQRCSGESSPATFYRIGSRLVVEHFRENGEVYYHEQELNETGIPWDRCRRLPATEFDRQLAAQSPVVLTNAEIARLPGYSHWSTEE